MVSRYEEKLALSNNPLFRGARLDDGQKTSLSDAGFVVRYYPAHKHILEDGGRESRVFIIQSGWGCLYKDLPNGERQIVDFTLGGEVIGLRPGGRKVEEAFVTITDLVVFEARVKTVISSLRSHEPLAEILFRAVSRQHAIAVQHLVDVGRRSGIVRTAHLLLELWVRLEASGSADDNGYDCPLTQYDLADALGLTAIHVNRMLRELRELGFLSFRKGKVEFHDLPSLIEFAGFDRGYLAS